MKKVILSAALSILSVVAINFTASANDEDKKPSTVEVKLLLSYFVYFYF